jgi:hypothetical protein
VSEVGHEDEEMVGVSPTLLPKRRNAEPVKKQKVTICRANFDAPVRMRTGDLRFRSFPVIASRKLISWNVNGFSRTAFVVAAASSRASPLAVMDLSD